MVEMLKGDLITFKRFTMNGKTSTRQVAIKSPIRFLQDAWEAAGDMPNEGYLFKSRHGGRFPHVSGANADLILGQACDLCGLDGVITHSFRRTYITKLRDKGYSPAQSQSRTGHKRRQNLMHYFNQIQGLKGCADSVC